jgi:N utilization substance protein A
VLVDDEAKQATVIVPDDQLSLAIGKDGLNARLAARLTGWRVDIRSETEFAEEESEMGYAEEDVAGRCATILANGKRCPNASLPGSRYCGLPAHQALEGTDTDYLVPPEEGEEEAAGNGELASDDAEVAVAEAVAVDEAAAEEAHVEDAPVEDALVEAVLEEAPVEEALVEDSAAADQPLDEEPVAEAEPVAEDEPADAEGEAAVAEDEALAEDDSVGTDEPLAEQEEPVEEAEES